MDEMGNKNSLTVGEISDLIKWLKVLKGFFELDEAKDNKDIDKLIKRLEEQRIQ